MATPRTVVTAPPAAAPRIGLIASFTPTTDSGSRWEGAGIAYTPEGCVTGETMGICTRDPYTANAINAAVEWDSYFLTIADECSTFSGVSEEDEARVRRLLAMDEERQLGAEFWDGAIAQSDPDNPNTWLSNDDAPEFTNLSTEPVGYVRALSCLQQYLSEHNGGQQGAIHATAQVVTHWESFRLLRREGNRLLTMQDHVVVPSPGYSGYGPDGGFDEVWAYATDLPRVFLGAVDVKRSIDRRDNTNMLVATRPALVEWQRCRHAGIQLAITPCGEY